MQMTNTKSDSLATQKIHYTALEALLKIKSNTHILILINTYLQNCVISTLKLSKHTTCGPQYVIIVVTL